MTAHLTDEQLSDLVDDRLSPAGSAEANGHLAACADCQHRLDQLQATVSLLRALPVIEPTRSFVLGPRAVADPPNVIRLRRWYAATRVAAASLAAVFVLLAGTTLFVDSRPVPASLATSESAGVSAASAPASGQGAPVRDLVKTDAATDASSTAAPRAAVAAQAPAAPAVPPAPAAARSAPAQAANGVPPDGGQLAAAATSAQPLPTLTPTATPVPPTAVPVAARVAAPSQPRDAAAPWRMSALGVGVLAVIALFAAVLVRHRLQRSTPRL